MRLLRLLLAGTAALSLFSASANAASITSTVTYGPAPTDYNNSVASLTLFNSTLGTLNDIRFSTTYGFNSTITLTNSSQSSSNGSTYTTSGAQFSSSNSSIASVLNSVINTAGSFSVGASTLNPVAYKSNGNTAAYNLSPGATTNVVSNSSTNSQNITDTNSSHLAAFTVPGGGSANLLFSTLTGLVLNNSGGNTTGSQVTTATGTFTITYDYTAPAPPPVSTTPEPSSLMLLGTGVLGIIGAARRRLS